MGLIPSRSTMETLRQPTTDFYPHTHNNLVSLDRYRQTRDVGKSLIQITPSQEASTKVYAFDLGVARQYALQHGYSYKNDFLKDVRYYANETYGKVSADVYSHEIKDREDGHSEIGFYRGTEWVSANESYAKVANDVTKPEWYRLRAQRDWQWVLNIEAKLNETKGQEDIPWVDVSPTAYKVSLEERRKANFNLHSFARVHWRSGNKLVSVAYRNYLDESSQPEFFKALTGKDSTTGEMLGKVENLKEGVAVTDVNNIAQAIYDATPKHQRVEIPEEEKDMKDKKEMKDYMHMTQPLLDSLYNQMVNPRVSNARVLENFKTWEKMLKALTKGETVDIDAIRYSHKSTLHKKRAQKELQRFQMMDYNPGRNDCGNGVGMNIGNRRTDGRRSMIPGSSVSVGLDSDEERAKRDPLYWKPIPQECVDPGCSHKGHKVTVGPCNICIDCEERHTQKAKLRSYGPLAAALAA